MAKKTQQSTRDLEKVPVRNSSLFLQDSFIEAFKSSGTILAACTRLNIARNTVYKWFEDEAFKQMWADAQEAVTELVETAAMARGVNGVERYVISGGKPVVNPNHACKLTADVKHCPDHWLKYREYSDHMLEKLLEARAPHKYARRFSTEVKIDVKLVAEITSDVMGVIRRNVPDACPHCKNVLGITPAIAEDMDKLSKKFEVRT
jgi:hypothetical protein